MGEADIVTLDRVICCYLDLDALAWKAAQRACIRLGLVYPRDHWWMRLGAAVINTVGRPFGYARFFIHRTAGLELILRSAGLEPEWSGGTQLWRVATYRRARPVSG